MDINFDFDIAKEFRIAGNLVTFDLCDQFFNLREFRAEIQASVWILVGKKVLGSEETLIDRRLRMAFKSKWL
jgi:hypothetical protein